MYMRKAFKEKKIEIVKTKNHVQIYFGRKYFKMA